MVSVLQRHGAMSRADLQRHVRLSRATVSSIVSTLTTAQVIIKLPAPLGERGRGRPVGLLSLNPLSGHAIGLDLAHGHVALAIANAARDFIMTVVQPCPARASLHDRLMIARQLIREAARDHGVLLSQVTGTGVGVVGPLGQDATGTEQLVRKALDNLEAPVIIDNNTRLAALAEAIWGKGVAQPNLCLVRLSDGVGGAVVVNGHLLNGAAAAAGELGHICVDPDGPPCSCGGRGCLERYVNLTTFLAGSGATTIADVVAKVTAGDARCTAAVAEAGDRIGRALAATVNVINPGMVLLGGELAELGQPLLDATHASMQRYTHHTSLAGTQVRIATLGADAGARGGVALVLRRSTLLTGYPVGASSHTSPPGEIIGG